MFLIVWLCYCEKGGRVKCNNKQVCNILNMNMLNFACHWKDWTEKKKWSLPYNSVKLRASIFCLQQARSIFHAAWNEPQGERWHLKQKWCESEWKWHSEVSQPAPCGVTCSHLTHRLVQPQKPAAESAGEGGGFREWAEVTEHVTELNEEKVS